MMSDSDEEVEKAVAIERLIEGTADGPIHKRKKKQERKWPKFNVKYQHALIIAVFQKFDAHAKLAHRDLEIDPQKFY